MQQPDGRSALERRDVDVAPDAVHDVSVPRRSGHVLAPALPLSPPNAASASARRPVLSAVPQRRTQGLQVPPPGPGRHPLRFRAALDLPVPKLRVSGNQLKSVIN